MIDIVIVNWNSGGLLENCVTSITNSSPYVSSISVIDNSSKDNSCRFLIGNNDIQLIKNSSNLGFSRSCNIGAQNGFSDYILFLNPDAELYASTLMNLLSFMQDPINSRVGICGVQLLDESKNLARSCSRFPSPIRLAIHSIGLDQFFPHLGCAMEEWAHDQTRLVDQVIGAFFLVRRSLFNELKGFDERFFVYFEEVDFCYRAHKIGWKTVYLTNTQAFHIGGGTSRQVKAHRLFYSLRSRLLYSKKHFSLIGFCLVLATTILIEPLSRITFAIYSRSWPAIKETLIGYILLLQWLLFWLFKESIR